MMSKLVGTWTTQGARNGEPFSGLYQARWNDSHTGLVYRSREGSQTVPGIGYWDFKTNEMVETWQGFALTAVLRFKADSQRHWSATAWLQTNDGEQIETSPAQLDFRDNELTFSGQAGNNTLTVANTRVALSDSQAALEEWGKFVIGGTWVCSDQTPTAKHTYQWRPGQKVLMLDRQGGRYPGVSLIALDHHWQCVGWFEVDDTGMLGSAQMVRTDKDTWHLFGHYESDSHTQDSQLTIRRIGPDEVHVSGIDMTDGVVEKIEAERWKRTPSKL